MPKKSSKTKKILPLERIAIALENIAKSLEIKNEELSRWRKDVLPEIGYITFPAKTAKEIIDECDNKVAGGKLICSTWMSNEDFFTKEKCRPRTVKIPTEILHSGKSWNECKELVVEENMFNFAEIVYMLRESESFRKLLSYPNEKNIYYTWTNSRDSGGGLVSVGYFDSGGVKVGGWPPRRTDSYLGVALSKS